MLDGKRILLVITGGIAAYKCLDLIRRVRERGGRVRCILTPAGAQFVTPLALAALSEDRVFQDLFSLTDENEIGHIRLSREADAVLVAPKNRAQDVKAVVARLKEQNRSETELGRQVFRPWGSYDSIDHGDGFQVKRLIVNPGARLSLQMHRHRAEHWIVVRGTARITRGEEVFDLQENESTFIPIGTKHRIENPGTEPVHIIEVQSGSYLGEDDIVRFEDTYGRKGRTD